MAGLRPTLPQVRVRLLDANLGWPLPGQGRFLLSTCATRAFTSFLTSAIGSGLSVGKWMVPLDVEKPFSSSLKASTTAAVGNKLQWLENAANHSSIPLYLNAGIR